nr:hypothetical protein Iba_chr09eCG10610 [Ipomoea batatas]
MISRAAIFDKHSMLRLKKGDALVEGSSTIEVDINRVSLTERAYNPPMIDTQEVIDSTSTKSATGSMHVYNKFEFRGFI